MTQPILSASSSVTSRPSIPASHLPANTRVPPEAISSSRCLDASLWCSEYQSVARSIALLAQYPIAAPMPISRRVLLLCFVMGRPSPSSVGQADQPRPSHSYTLSMAAVGRRVHESNKLFERIREAEGFTPRLRGAE